MKQPLDSLSVRVMFIFVCIIISWHWMYLTALDSRWINCAFSSANCSWTCHSDSGELAHFSEHSNKPDMLCHVLGFRYQERGMWSIRMQPNKCCSLIGRYLPKGRAYLGIISHLPTVRRCKNLSIFTPLHWYTYT